MTSKEKIKMAWLGYMIACDMGWRAESQECLKEHFRFVDEAAQERTPELYDPTRRSFIWDGRRASSAAEKSEKA
jgi:ligand-binding SRPBCC domain-containing protein